MSHATQISTWRGKKNSIGWFVGKKLLPELFDRAKSCDDIRGVFGALCLETGGVVRVML